MHTLTKYLVIALPAVALSASAVEQPPPIVTRAAVLMTKSLPGIQGKEGMMLTVELPPGAESPAHRHNANTFVYVLEGSVVMQVLGGDAVTLKPGQTFYESPTDIHSVSKNASVTEPAKILVFMVKDSGAPASEPVK